MRIFQKTLLQAAALGTGLLASDSILAADMPSQVKKENILAKLHLKDGGTVEFLELAPGELAVVAQTRAGPQRRAAAHKINGVPLIELKRLSPLDKYKVLSGGQQPPSALVQAQNRSLKAIQRERSSKGAQQDEMKPPAHHDGTQPKALTAAVEWFQHDYCDGGPYYGGYEFSYCFLYRTGDAGTIVEDGYDMTSVASPYQGQVRHTIDWWCSGSWCQSISRPVAQGWVNTIWSSGPFRFRRGTLREAVGDGFHWAIYGDKDGLGTYCPHGGC